MPHNSRYRDSVRVSPRAVTEAGRSASEFLTTARVLTARSVAISRETYGRVPSRLVSKNNFRDATTENDGGGRWWGGGQEGCAQMVRCIQGRMLSCRSGSYFFRNDAGRNITMRQTSVNFYIFDNDFSILIRDNPKLISRGGLFF